MIDQKVITGIMFGAACLLGIGSCTKKKLPKTAEAYANEIYAHVQHLFKKQNIPFDDAKIQAWSESLTINDVNKIKKFFNKIYTVYFKNRNDLESIGNYFNGQPLTYEKFFFIEAAPQVRQILLACLECTIHAEQLLGSGNTSSTACADYLARRPHNGKEHFELLFKPIIHMHLHYRGPKTPSNEAKRLNGRAVVKHHFV